MFTEVTPQRIALEATAARARAREATVASKWQIGGAEVRSRKRLASEPIRRFLRSSKHSVRDKAYVAAAACNAIWTRTRFAEAGVMVDVTCSLCGKDPDTVHHRLWVCSAAFGQRRSAATSDDIKAAVAAGPLSVLHNRRWMLHPGAAWPTLSESLEDQFEVNSPQGPVEVSDRTQWLPGFGLPGRVVPSAHPL